MIPTSAIGTVGQSGFQAIIVSEETKRAAPAPADTFPVANAVASMAEMTSMYRAPGRPAAVALAAPSGSGLRRRHHRHHHDGRDGERTPGGTSHQNPPR